MSTRMWVFYPPHITHAHTHTFSLAHTRTLLPTRVLFYAQTDTHMCICVCAWTRMWVFSISFEVWGMFVGLFGIKWCGVEKGYLLQPCHSSHSFVCVLCVCAGHDRRQNLLHCKYSLSHTHSLTHTHTRTYIYACRRTHAHITNTCTHTNTHAHIKYVCLQVW